MQEKIEFKVTSNRDVDIMNPKDFEKIDHVHMDLTNSKLDESKFFEIFDRLAETKQNRKFHLDLTKVDLDEQKVNRIVNCFENWSELTNLHLHAREMKLDDREFEKLLNKGISKLQNLTKIHIALQNVNMNTAKLTSLQNLVKTLPKLVQVKFNLNKENLTQKEIQSIEEITKNKPMNEIIWT